MQHITVTETRKGEGCTTQRTWRFWIHFPWVILDCYTEGERTGRQRNFRIVRSYYRTDRRASDIGIADVHRPAWVEAEVRAQIMSLMEGRVRAMPESYTGWEGGEHFTRPGDEPSAFALGQVEVS